MPKILVAGDVGGNLEELYKRVSTVNAKSGPFDCLLCAGEFFGSADVGGIRAPPSAASKSRACARAPASLRPAAPVHGARCPVPRRPAVRHVLHALHPGLAGRPSSCVDRGMLYRR
jgi:hypothetical protein